MNTFAKYATAAAFAGALAVPMATPSMAEHGRNAAAAIGFGAGALVGAAAASAAGPHYYDAGYAYEPGYAYAPGYAYEPGPAVDAYAYAPAPRGYYRSSDRNERRCMTSPGSLAHEACDNH